MPLLKEERALPQLKDAVVLDLGDLADQGRRVIEAARERAGEILAQARREAQEMTETAAEQGREAGHVEGKAAGHAEGLAAGHAEAVESLRSKAQPLHKALQTVLDGWNEQRRVFEDVAQIDVLRLAVALGAKIVHRHVQTDPSVVTEQVSAALRRVLETTDLRLRIHPDDRPVLAETLPDLLAGLAHLKHVDLADDPAVGRGGCAVDLPDGGGVDASIDVQLERIAAALLPGGNGETPSESESEGEGED